jgi:hypothetical protein
VYPAQRMMKQVLRERSDIPIPHQLRPSSASDG